ncbi:MAG: hypothetical protein LBU37_14605 [Tannerellaceae bacterium]|nr:hypothetical protein [Tannerellaceae bacterium]
MKKYHLLLFIFLLQYPVTAQDFSVVDSFFFGKIAEKQSDFYLFENGSLKKIDSRRHSIYHHLPAALSGGGGWYDSYGGAVSAVSDFYLLADWLLNRDKNLHMDILRYNSLKIMLSYQTGELTASGRSKFGLGTGIAVGDNGETKEAFGAGFTCRVAAGLLSSDCCLSHPGWLYGYRAGNGKPALVEQSFISIL